MTNPYSPPDPATPNDVPTQFPSGKDFVVVGGSLFCRRECDLTFCCFETGETAETARLSEMTWRPSCLDRKSQFLMLCLARGFVRLAVTPLPVHRISVVVDIGAN